MSMKLHIGCGSDIRDGYINIDEFNPQADVNLALQELSYPTGTVERIEGYMVLEHLSPADARLFLANAYRMLQRNGTLVLEVPDLAKVARLTLIFANDPEQLENGPFGLRGVFGEPTNQMTLGDYHKWGYTPALAESIVREAGFSKVTISDGFSHRYPLRDMRIEAVK